MNDRDAKLAQARQRHGKPFHIEIRQPRKTPKSAFLRRLERLQRRAAANVVSLSPGGAKCEAK